MPWRRLVDLQDWLPVKGISACPAILVEHADLSAVKAVMVDIDTRPVLWYFADPMCSWCWGFSPVIERIKTEYGDRVHLSLNLGGLRPGTRAPMTDSLREEILHHWQQVNKLTGQPFKFDGALPEGFIYDTEPASRAILVVGKLQPEQTMACLASVHRAFYSEGRDVTQQSVLAGIAESLGVSVSDFNTGFESSEARKKTQQHFQRTRQAGVNGFPTTVWQHGEQVELLAAGYTPYETIAEKIEQKLKDHAKEAD